MSVFLFFPMNTKNNQKFLGYGNNRKYTENRFCVMENSRFIYYSLDSNDSPFKYNVCINSIFYLLLISLNIHSFDINYHLSMYMYFRPNVFLYLV